MPSNTHTDCPTWLHGDKAWAYALKLESDGWPDMTRSFPPTYGLLTATLQPDALETIERNVAAGNPRPEPRFFVPFRNDGKPDWDEPRILGRTVAPAGLFRSKTEAVHAYNQDIRKAIAITEGTARRLKSMLVNNVPKTELDDLARLVSPEIAVLPYGTDGAIESAFKDAGVTDYRFLSRDEAIKDTDPEVLAFRGMSGPMDVFMESMFDPDELRCLAIKLSTDPKHISTALRKAGEDLRWHEATGQVRQEEGGPHR